MDWVEFITCIQENILNQDGHTGEVAKLNLLLGNTTRQVNEVLVGEHFRTSDNNSISFKIIREKDTTGPKFEVLNLGNAKLLTGNGISGKRKALQCDIVTI